jgi:hypothetical protein
MASRINASLGAGERRPETGRGSLSRGVGILNTARELQIGSERVQRVNAAMQAAET